MPVPQLVEVPLIAPNTQAPSTATPPGRLARLLNAVVTQFEGGRLKVGARDGFRQLSMVVNNPDPTHFGNLSLDGFAAPPTLLNSFRDQLVVVADQRPHVLAEDAPAWSQLPYTLSPTTLRLTPFYAATNSITCPDAACIGDVVCDVWKQTNETTGTTTAYVTIRDKDGTPLRLPVGLADSAENAPVVIKVVQDGTHFWVFNSAGTTMQVFVFDTTGALLIQHTFATLGIVEGPPNIAARWDVACDKTGIVKWFGPTSTVDSALYHLTYSSGPPTVTATLHNLTTPMSGVDAFGAIAFLTNTGDASHSYLALYSYTAGLHAYSLDNTGSVAHHYTIHAASPTLDALQLAGYVGDALTVHTMLSIQATPVSYTDVYHCTTSDTVTHETRNTITVASRSFELAPGLMTNIVYYTDASGQGTFFLYDWSHGQVIGCWAHGSAAQDWQDSPSGQGYLSRDNFSVPSPYLDNAGATHFAVGYLAETFVRGVKESTTAANGKFQVVTVDKWVSAVGLADVVIGTDGEAVEYADTLMLPGPLANDFTGMTFQEDNFCLYPAPFTLTPSHSDAGNLGAGLYSYVLCWAWTDSNGNRVRSRPSDPQTVDLTGGSNNVVTLEVPTLFLTNKADVQLEVYRTFLVAGSPSTQHKKITDDLKPVLNDKASVTITWSDNVSDDVAQVGQTLYTDDGLLPHDACPAFSTGCVAGARVFVAGFDGNVYYSNEKVPGEPLTFNVDTLRMTPPSADPILQLKALDSSRVILLCAESVWEWDITQLPGPDGLGGNVPAPTRLQGFAGCTGKAALIKEGVIYSTDTGPWLVSRGLENGQIGAAAVAEFVGHEIVGFAQDSDQRLLIGTPEEEDKSVIRDGISGVWSTFAHPSEIGLVHQWHGRFCYSDLDSVRVQEKGLPADVYQVTTLGEITTRTLAYVPPTMDILTAPIQIGTVKGMKVLWTTLVTGEYLGPHRLLVDFEYLTEDGIVTESFVIDPDPDDPQYEHEFQPIVEEVESVTIRLRSDFTGLINPPGTAFTLELLSFEVGIDDKLTRTPPTVRRAQSA